MATADESRPMAASRINWALVGAIAGPTLAIVMLVGSMLLLQGQTTARIDSTRTELRTAIDSTRTELLDEIDSTRTELLDEIRMLRESVTGLTSPDLSEIQDDLAGIKALLERNADG